MLCDKQRSIGRSRHDARAVDGRFVSSRAGLRMVTSGRLARGGHTLQTMRHIIPAVRSKHFGRHRSACRVWSTAAALVFGLGACGATQDAGPKANRRSRIEPRDTRLTHEDCPVSGAGSSSEDINGDGRADRRTVSLGARPRCRTLDFDFDGVVDAWVFLDGAGQLRRRESDFDGDGRVDEVSLYRAGVLVEEQRVTTRAGKLDTWHYFRGGRVARTERDSNGDDYVDQWWEYPDQRPSDCPLIHSDVDGDGQPDPGATVDVCRDRYDSQAARADAPQRGVGEAPTELTTPVEGGSSEGAPAVPAGTP
jgi:hypothetical protein